VQVRAARLGEGEHPLVRPAFLADHPGLDQPVPGEPFEFPVELLRGGRPEVGERDVEQLGQLVARRLALQERGQDGVLEGHVDNASSGLSPSSTPITLVDSAAVTRACREAGDAQDLDAAVALLAEDVVFTSPVVFKPSAGKATTAAILRAVAEVFEDFRYVREIHDTAG